MSAAFEPVTFRTMDGTHITVTIDGDARSRLFYARKTKDPEAVALLARDPEFQVRAEAVRNWNCPAEIRDAAADDPSPLVRSKVAATTRNPKIMLAMASDPYLIVRWGLKDTARLRWKNPIPAEVENAVQAIENVQVTLTDPKGGPDVTVPLSQAEYGILRWNAEHSRDPEFLRTLAYYPGSTVRYAVVENPATSRDVRMGTLAHDPLENVASHAFNVMSPQDGLEACWGSESSDVLAGLIRQMKQYGMSMELATDKFKRNRSARIRQLVGPFVTSDDDLWSYVLDYHPYTRMSVTDNPRLTEEMQVRLLADADSRVRATALAGTLTEKIAFEQLDTVDEKDYPSLAALLTQPVIPVETRAARAVTCRSVKVRNAFVDSLSPEQASALSASGDKKIAAMISKRLVNQVIL